MALMYDMETVNRAMTEAAKLYDPKHKSAKRVMKVLNIFAAIKPVEVAERHARWLLHHVSCLDGKALWVCSNCKRVAGSMNAKVVPNESRCLCCNAIMDGRPER